MGCDRLLDIDLQNWLFALKEYGFRQSYSDCSLFILQQGKVQIHVLVYVDDLIVSGSDFLAIQLFKKYLSSCFYMKDL